MEFVDFKEHLQKLLDNIATDTFEVSLTRDMVGKTDKVVVVLTALVGQVFENSATIPYQVDIFSNDPDSVQNIFTKLAKDNNSKSFISVVEEEDEVKEYTVFGFYGTPTVIDRQVEFGVSVYANSRMFVDLNVLFQVGNVAGIKIGGEELDFIDGSLSYGIETFSNRETGKNLNQAVKKSSTTNLQILMVNKTSFFTNKVLEIMFGLQNGNLKFDVEVRLTNGFVGKLAMIINQSSLGFAKNSPKLPSLNITLTTAKAN